MCVEPATRGKRSPGQPRSSWRPQLGEHDQLVQWLTPLMGPQWMQAEPLAPVPERLDVRERRYRVHRKGLRVTSIPLDTPLLAAPRYTVEALAQLYWARWGMETHLAHWKTTMGLAVLKGKTVDGVLKERIVFALIDTLVRLVMAQAARRHHVAIDRISFVDAARWLAAARDEEALPGLVVHPHRPYQYEPRVRKRRPKQYPLMQNTRQAPRKALANKRDMD